MNKVTSPNITFQHCDFSHPSHQKAFIQLIDEYIQHPMGDAAPLSYEKKQLLLEDLAQHPSVLTIFAIYENEYAGLAVGFIKYSTFCVAPYVNVHDFIITQTHRNKKLGHLLLTYLINLAKERRYCKVNLEVRTDNQVAQDLYRSLGFTECHPPMLFWQKLL